MLQGGQAQRVTLAICLALKPDFLLLDGEPLKIWPAEQAFKGTTSEFEAGFAKVWLWGVEPTSALDQDSARAVEQVLKESGAGLIWVTHDDNQPGRIGGRVLSLPLGTEVPS